MHLRRLDYLFVRRMIVSFESRALIHPGQTALPNYTEQLAQFTSRSEVILEGVLIQFPEKAWTAFLIAGRSVHHGAILQEPVGFSHSTTTKSGSIFRTTSPTIWLGAFPKRNPPLRPRTVSR